MKHGFTTYRYNGPLDAKKLYYPAGEKLYPPTLLYYHDLSIIASDEANERIDRLPQYEIKFFSLSTDIVYYLLRLDDTSEPKTWT